MSCSMVLGLKLPRWCFLTISWAADLSSLLLHRLSLTAVTHTSTFHKNMLQSRISIGVTYALNWQRNFFHLLTNFLIAYTLCNPYYLFFIFAQRLLVSSIRLKSFVLQIFGIHFPCYGYKKHSWCKTVICKTNRQKLELIMPGSVRAKATLHCHGKVCQSLGNVILQFSDDGWFFDFCNDDIHIYFAVQDSSPWSR